MGAYLIFAGVLGFFFFFLGWNIFFLQTFYAISIRSLNFMDISVDGFSYSPMEGKYLATDPTADLRVLLRDQLDPGLIL